MEKYTVEKTITTNKETFENKTKTGQWKILTEPVLHHTHSAKCIVEVKILDEETNATRGVKIVEMIILNYFNIAKREYVSHYSPMYKR